MSEKEGGSAIAHDLITNSFIEPSVSGDGEESSEDEVADKAF
jgi:hypothetical protein